MEQLKVKDITRLIIELKNKGLSMQEINELPIYLGNDDELNGIHNGWYCQLIDKNDTDEDTEYLIDLIEQDFATSDLEDKGILIS